MENDLTWNDVNWGIPVMEQVEFLVVILICLWVNIEM